MLAQADIIHWLRYTLPGFVFSVGQSAASAAAALAALEILRAEPERVHKLGALSAYFVESAIERGFDINNAAGHGIVPVYFPNVGATLHAAAGLWKMGFTCPLLFGLRTKIQTTPAILYFR